MLTARGNAGVEARQDGLASRGWNPLLRLLKHLAPGHGRQGIHHGARGAFREESDGAVTEQEVAAAQQQMNESVAVAQRNLSSAKSHQLSATQTDLASKVTSFLEESKAAVKDGDWTRAKNLAKKAQVLSEELAESL